MKKHRGLIVILILVFLLYSPALCVFFSQDDFFHLSLGQNIGLDLLTELLGPYHGINYRPVFQVMTWFFYKLYGFQSSLFHLTQLVIHLLTTGLCFLLIKKLLNRRLALWTAFFYGASPCLFMAIYWWGASHVLLMVFFSLLSFYLLFDHPWISSLLLLLALFSNELGVMFPLIVFLILFHRKKTKFAYFLFVPLLIYFSARFVFSPPSFTYEYRTAFDVVSLVRNLRWYALRILGLPEGVRILLQEQEVFLLTSINILLAISFGTTIVWLFYLLLKKFNFKKDFVFIWGAWWFFLGFLLILPLVFHQSSFYLVLSLVGFGLCLAFLIEKLVKKDKVKILIATLYVILSFTSLSLSRQTHWVVRRANLARKSVDQVAQELGKLKGDEVIVFLNGKKTKATEVYLSMSGPDALRVYYKNPELKVLFEGFDKIPEDRDGVYFFDARD